MRSLASTIWRSTCTARAKATRHHDRRLSLFTETLERRQTPTASPLASLYVDPDPQSGSGFGTDVVLLPNGNVVVSAPFQDITGPKNVIHDDAGAVYLFDGRTGNVLATLIGTSPGDRVGSGGITLLANGSYVVASPHWDNVSGTIEDAGAVTWRPGSVPASQSPVIEKVSTSNSLHGTSAFDLVGISSEYDWARNFSSADHDSPLQPPVQLEFTDFDGVTPLPNGNYVVSSPWWDNGTTEDAGAVILVGDKGIPVAGQTVGSAITTANSLHGTSPEDRVGGGYKDTSAGIKGLGITPIAAPGRDPTFVVSSPSWTNPDAEPCRYATRVDHGAVTFVNGRTGHVAGDGAVGVAVVASNSVHGELHSARIGAGGVTPLARHGVHTGAYVISSPLDWFHSDPCPPGITVESPASGAATWVGADGRVIDDRYGRLFGAEVTDKNSLRGPESLGKNPVISAFSRVSSGGIVALADGNYAVVSPEWNLVEQDKLLNLEDCGAVTFGDGTTGTRGFVTTTNSVHGSEPYSRVGSGGVTALDDGSYFVSSPKWGRNDANGDLILNVGAVTRVGRDGLVNGIRSAAVDSGNSLTGVTGGVDPERGGDQVGSGGITKVRLAGTDYYAVSSPLWNRPAGKGAEGIEEVGAVTLLKATGEVVIVDPVDSRRLDTAPRGSTVAVTNSLHGDEKGDRVGSGGVTPLVKGNFVVNSPEWRSGKTLQEIFKESGGSGGSTGGSGPGGGDAGGGAPDRVDRGAATWVGQLPNGTFRGIGSPAKVVVSPSNSLVGSSPLDQVGSGGVVALATGHYAVVSPAWDHNGVVDVGAVTWGSGVTGAVGRVVGGTGRTLHGSTADDRVGSGRSLGDLEFRLGRGGVTPLSDGSYVVASPHWSSPDIVGSSGERIVNDAGAVTRIGPDGLIAPWAASAHTQVSTRNSLVGTLQDDRVGSGGVTALAKGHYLVTSPEWGFVEGVGGDRGAITWVAGGAARGAKVTPANSRFGQVTEPGIILDNRNGRFLVGLREATPNGGSNNRVVAGWQTKGFVDVQASTEAAMAGSDTRRSSPSAAAAVPVVAREAAFAALGSLGTEAGAGSTAATTGGPTARTARSVVLRR